MSGILTRWPVVQRHAVAPGDLDESGAVLNEVVEQLIVAARSAYLDQCVVLRDLRERRGLEFDWQPEELARDALSGRPEAVIVSASVPELRPASITLLVRLRPIGGDEERPVNSRGAVRLVDPSSREACELGNDVRDELIALEQAAKHFN